MGSATDAVTAGKMLTPWLVLGKASTNNTLERERTRHTPLHHRTVEQRGMETPGRGEPTSLPAGFKQRVRYHTEPQT